MSLKTKNKGNGVNLSFSYADIIQGNLNPFCKKLNKNRNYPLLIVETLPKTFGKIDKIDTKKQPNISKEEGILLNLIARIIVEIFIKEEL